MTNILATRAKRIKLFRRRRKVFEFIWEGLTMFQVLLIFGAAFPIAADSSNTPPEKVHLIPIICFGSILLLLASLPLRTWLENLMKRLEIKTPLE